MNDSKDAPKDGTTFLGDFGHHELLITAWDEEDGEWATAMMEQCGMESGRKNRYFVNENFYAHQLKGWQPLP